MSESFFGTDGIRGETSLSPIDEDEAIEWLTQQRTLTPTFMRVLGEALSYEQPAWPGKGATVVIGWDRRPHNEALVRALTLGLRLTGSTVVHIGACATPTLHHAVLAFGARMGCMITASHNPVSDSGIKVFDANGYKATPDLERNLSRTLRQLASEDREVDEVDRTRCSVPDEVHDSWGLMAHGAWLAKRWVAFREEFGGCEEALTAGFIAQPLLLDSANGFAASWLSDWLTGHGVDCLEVSAQDGVLNQHCGAGDISPTQTWTHEEAAASPHALLQQLQPAPAGQWVGAALDGDGDRCLLIEATETGFKVVDGDAMAALLIAASHSPSWSFAASIESDVALMHHVASLRPGSTVTETAVGDRWLSFALRPSSGSLVEGDSMPSLLGIEDSGHVVLPAPHPTEARWSMVGDGAATLCAVLLSADRGRTVDFPRGWKRRVSISPSQRERWHNAASVFQDISTATCEALAQLGLAPTVRSINGEDHLLLIHAEGEEGVASIGVRNSGTQAKTNVSLRLSPGLDSAPFEQLMADLQATLQATLSP